MHYVKVLVLINLPRDIDRPTRANDDPVKVLALINLTVEALTIHPEKVCVLKYTNGQCINTDQPYSRSFCNPSCEDTANFTVNALTIHSVKV